MWQTQGRPGHRPYRGIWFVWAWLYWSHQSCPPWAWEPRRRAVGALPPRVRRRLQNIHSLSIFYANFGHCSKVLLLKRYQCVLRTKMLEDHNFSGDILWKSSPRSANVQYFKGIRFSIKNGQQKHQEAYVGEDWAESEKGTIKYSLSSHQVEPIWDPPTEKSIKPRKICLK